MEQPTHCIVRKVIWGVLVGFGALLFLICLIWLINDNRSNGDDSVFPIIGVMLGFCALVISGGLIPWAFEPELDKMKKERELYKKHQGKELEEEFYSVDADIHHRSIKKRTRSFKQGLSVEKCPKCGDYVESNENFCNKCGAEIYKKCTKCKTVNEAGDEFCRNCGNKLKEQ